MQELTIETEERNLVTVIRLAGHFARLEVYKVKNTVDTLLSEGKQFFVLSLTEADFIDSAGIGVIVYLAKAGREAKGRLALVEPISAGPKEMLHKLLLGNLCDKYSSESEALRAISEQFNLGRLDQNRDESAVMLEVARLASRLDSIDGRLRRLERLAEENNSDSTQLKPTEE